MQSGEKKWVVAHLLRLHAWPTIQNNRDSRDTKKGSYHEELGSVDLVSSFKQFKSTKPAIRMQRCTKKGTSNTPISNVLIYQQSRVGIAASYEFYYIPVLQFYNVLDPFCKFSLPLPWIQGQAPNCHLCTIWQLPLHTNMDSDYMQLTTHQLAAEDLGNIPTTRVYANFPLQLLDIKFLSSVHQGQSYVPCI